MSEIRYKLELPKGLTCSECMFGLDITKEQASSLREQCEAIEAQPEGRQWRDGDMVRQIAHVAMDSRAIHIRGNFIQGEPHWIHAGKSNLSPHDFENSSIFTYLGNLCDLLAQGEILISLKETELVQAVNWSHGTQLMAKLASYLADYRERRRQHETPA